MYRPVDLDLGLFGLDLVSVHVVPLQTAVWLTPEDETEAVAFIDSNIPEFAPIIAYADYNALFQPIRQAAAQTEPCRPYRAAR